MSRVGDVDGKLVVRFQNIERKRAIAEAAARERVPIVHFLWECFLAWKHQRELAERPPAPFG